MEYVRCGGEAGGLGDYPGCGEPIYLDEDGGGYRDDDVGEFWAGNYSAVMHAQCGLDAGLPLA